MLDAKLLRENLNLLKQKLSTRGTVVDYEQLETLESQRRSLQTTTQELQEERNRSAKMVAQAKTRGEDISAQVTAMRQLGVTLTEKEQELSEVLTRLQALQLRIPNIPHESVPIGKDENDNKEVRRWGEPTSFEFTPQDHTILGENLTLMDFSLAAKLTGARFVVLKGALAHLQRALTQFMLDVHTTHHGYQEVYVPYLLNQDSLIGTGQLPKFEEDQFKIAGDYPYYLSPTAEVAVTNFMRDVIVDEKELPLKFACHAPCFRSEAGSYGKDTKGMIRQHQFEKVELVWIVHPDNSYDALEQLTQHAEKILQLLELPYRVMSLCTGDMGFAAAKTYDLEVWLPGQNRYREISSCSNCEDFQARRMQGRFRDVTTRKPRLVHTLNGSGLAVGRTLVAVMENYQTDSGNIRIPKALQPYLGGKTLLMEM